MTTTISPYIWAIIAGWIIAQGLKYGFVALKTKSLKDLRQLYLSGNMPSAHSATAISLLTVIGLRDGIESGLFGLAALFSGVVLYDAMMVRRSVGEQGKAIQQLIKQENVKVALPRAAKGHTPLEVLVGSLLGLGIGLVVFFATL